MIQLYTFFKVLCVIYKGDKYMNHKILEHKFWSWYHINLYEV